MKKRAISVLLSLVMVLSMFPVLGGQANAVSSEAQNAARKLYELGLFSGTGTDANGNPIFDLDRAPTRHEAVTMLVRLLGKDGTAKSGSWSIPFTDVADWAKPYVGYAYANKLTGGTSATTFSGNDPVSATQYITFVLRALGYSSDSDFQWDKAWELSDKLGFTDGRYKGSSAAFTRGDVAIISAAALDAKLKGNSDTLLSTLQNSDAVASATISILPLQIGRKAIDVEGTKELSSYDIIWRTHPTVSNDLNNNAGLAYSLSFGSATRFNGKLPSGFDPARLMAWGMDPGLNIDLLHEFGYTGKGSIIAYVDQPFSSHNQYKDANIHYTETTGEDSSMHGPAVLGILAGKDTGIIPDAEIYYYSLASWKADQQIHADTIYKIIEKNKSLPENKKIRMLGLSDFIDSDEANPEAFKRAVQDAKDAGIMVWLADEFGGVTFIPYGNRNSYSDIMPAHSTNAISNRIYAPFAGITTAATLNGNNSIYWMDGCVSWSTPYMVGLFAIVSEIDPTLTQDDLRNLAYETAYIYPTGMNVVNPTAMVITALRNVGRSDEADRLETAVKARESYAYALVDKGAMTASQLNAIADYLTTITDDTVLVVNVSGHNVADAVEAIKADHVKRGGIIAGVSSLTVDSSGSVQNVAVDNYKAIATNSIVPLLLLPFSSFDKANALERFSRIQQTCLITDGEPIGASFSVQYGTWNQFPAGDTGAVSNFTAQHLNNGYTRISFVCVLPKDSWLDLSAFDPPNGDVFKIINIGYFIPGKNMVIIDLKDTDLQAVDKVSIMAFSNNVWFGTSFTTKQLFDSYATQGGQGNTQQNSITLTDGKPVGEPKEIKYRINNELSSGTATIHSYTAQPLDNGYTRFTVEYTVPAGLNIFVFNPPNGQVVAQRDNSGTSDEKSTLIFELSDADIAAVTDGININFYSSDSNGCFVYFNISQLK